jgi:hypothetical protein
MIRYLYVPIDKDLDEFIEFSIENHFNQIIHGESDIINDLISNKNEIQKIEIPEFRFIDNKDLVFKENETFIIKIIDEFCLSENYKIVGANLYRLDDRDINKKEFVLYKEGGKIDYFNYQVELNIILYGEYLVEIIIEKEGLNECLMSDKIIIYKEWKDKEELDDKFFFAD